MRILIILLSFISYFQLVFAALWSPIFVVDSTGALNNVYSSPYVFSKNHKKILNQITHETIKKEATVIIFVEETLSMEDIASKDEQGTPYLHLHKALLNNHAKFLPAVEHGFNILTRTFPREGDNEFIMESKATTLHLFNRNYKNYYVFFKDLKNTTRVELLRQHDLIMRDVCFVVRQLLPSRVIVFYTGKKNPIVASRFKYAEPRYPIFVHPYKFRDEQHWSYLKLGGMYFILRDGRTKDVTNVITTSVLNTKNMAKNKLDVTIFFSPFNLTFRFKFNDKEWKLVRLRQTGLGTSDFANVTSIGAPWNRSFICSTKPIIMKNNNIPGYYAFVIEQFQIQLSTTNFTNFGKPTFCEENIIKFMKQNKDDESADAAADEKYTRRFALPGLEVLNEQTKERHYIYFSPVIVKVLSVAIVLIAVLSFGIYMMMSLQTFSKYDDPNAKQLVIRESRL